MQPVCNTARLWMFLQCLSLACHFSFAFDLRGWEFNSLEDIGRPVQSKGILMINNLTKGAIEDRKDTMEVSNTHTHTHKQARTKAELFLKFGHTKTFGSFGHSVKHAGAFRASCLQKPESTNTPRKDKRRLMFAQATEHCRN